MSKVKQSFMKADGKVKISKSIAPKKKSKVTDKRKVEAPQDVSEVYVVLFTSGKRAIAGTKEKAEEIKKKYSVEAIAKFRTRVGALFWLDGEDILPKDNHGKEESKIDAFNKSIPKFRSNSKRK